MTLRITFVWPVPKPNGGNRIAAAYADRLIQTGHDVTIVTRMEQKLGLGTRAREKLRKGPKSAAASTAFLDRFGERHVQIPWKFPLDASDVPDADIVVATWWRTAFEVAALPPEKGKKVYFIQGLDVPGRQTSDLDRGSYYLPLKKITVAQWLVDILAKDFGDQDVALVPNSVDTKQFDAPLRSKRQSPTIGFLYSTKHIKGSDIVLKAVNKARQTIPDLRVVAFSAEQVDSATPLPKDTQFHFVPAQNDIPGLYASCDAWLFASRREGFGLPILEAMACRTPVIGSAAAAAPDIIEDGKNGYLVGVDDPDAMAKRIVDIATQSEQSWVDMSTAAHETARRYTWDEAARKFEESLIRIAEGT